MGEPLGQADPRPAAPIDPPRTLAWSLPLAWLVCLAPRVAFVLIQGIEGYGSYGAFVFERRNEYWYPAYEALAETLWAWSGESIDLHVGLHMLLHALLGPLAYLLARALDWSRRAAWLGVLGVSFVPYLIAVAGRQPQVGIVLVAVATLLVVFALWARGGYPLCLGLLFGLLGFGMLPLRPNALTVVVALLVFAAFRTRQRRAVWASAGCIVGLVLAVGSFQALRGGGLSILPSVTGLNLYIGNNPDVAEYVRRYDIDSLQDALFASDVPETKQAGVPEADARLLELALTFIREHPGETLSNTFWKGVRYWDVRLEDAETTPRLSNLSYTVPYLIYGCLALFGAVRLWQRGDRGTLAFLTVVVLAYWAPHLVFYGTIRYRMTTEIVLILLAAYAVDETWTRLRSRGEQRAGQEPSSPSSRASTGTAASATTRLPAGVRWMSSQK